MKAKALVSQFLDSFSTGDVEGMSDKLNRQQH